MKNIVFAAVALFAVSANANDALIALDLDQDGAISQEEAANVDGMSAEAWAILDANADGQLDEAEFAMLEEIQATPVEAATDATAEVTETATDAAVEVTTGAVETAVESVEGVVEAASE